MGFVLLCRVCRSLFVSLTIVFSVLRFTASDYPFGIFKLFLSLFPSATVSVLLRFTASDYPFGIFKFFLSLFPSATVSVLLRFKSSDYTFGIFELFLSPFLLAIVLSVLRFTASAYLSLVSSNLSYDIITILLKTLRIIVHPENRYTAYPSGAPEFTPGF